MGPKKTISKHIVNIKSDVSKTYWGNCIVYRQETDDQNLAAFNPYTTSNHMNIDIKKENKISPQLRFQQFSDHHTTHTT